MKTENNAIAHHSHDYRPTKDDRWRCTICGEIGTEDEMAVSNRLHHEALRLGIHQK